MSLYTIQGVFTNGLTLTGTTDITEGIVTNDHLDVPGLAQFNVPWQFPTPAGIHYVLNADDYILAYSFTSFTAFPMQAGNLGVGIIGGPPPDNLLIVSGI